MRMSCPVDIIVRSSAYAIILVVSLFVGSGRSEENRLNSMGDRMAPWGTPFFKVNGFENWPKQDVWAVLPDTKFASHFLKCVGSAVEINLCIRMCFGTVSNALFMSIAVIIVL